MNVTMNSAQREKGKLLSVRARELADSCAKMTGNDDSDLIYAHETAFLSALAESLRHAVDAHRLRLDSCFRVMEAVFDAQEDCIRQAMAQTEKARKQ